jgi:hypothetical protein
LPFLKKIERRFFMNHGLWLITYYTTDYFNAQPNIDFRVEFWIEELPYVCYAVSGDFESSGTNSPFKNHFPCNFHFFRHSHFCLGFKNEEPASGFARRSFTRSPGDVGIAKL